MNEVQVALVLDRLGANYHREVSAEELAVWTDHLSGVQIEVAERAMHNVIEVEAFFPPVAVFQREVTNASRDLAKEREAMGPAGGGPNPDCERCYGKQWYEVEPTAMRLSSGHVTYSPNLKPCPDCNMDGYERWERHLTERRQPRPPRSTDEALPFNLQDMLANARAALDPSGRT